MQQKPAGRHPEAKMKITIRDMTLISLFTVLIVIGGKISLTLLAVPFTLQSLICLLAGILLGARRAMLAMALYLLIGLLGLPVFAAGGSVAYVLQPTFGFLLGMLLASGLIGWLTDRLDPERKQLKVWQALPVTLIGQLTIYVFGVTYLYLIKNLYAGQGLTFVRAIEIGMIPFLLFDTLKSLLAAVIGPRLRRATRLFFQQPAAKDRRQPTDQGPM
jgi:biotin transport system substrate-specific component